MTPVMWMLSVIGAVIIAMGIASWMTHLSMAVGKLLAELHAINEKLGGQLDWLKSLDTKVDDHERRITRLEPREDFQ